GDGDVAPRGTRFIVLCQPVSQLGGDAVSDLGVHCRLSRLSARRSTARNHCKRASFSEQPKSRAISAKEQRERLRKQRTWRSVSAKPARARSTSSAAAFLEA